VPSDKRERKRSKQERAQAFQDAARHRKRRRSRRVQGVAIVASVGIAIIGVSSFAAKTRRSLGGGRAAGPATTTTISFDTPCPRKDGQSTRKDSFRRPPPFCINPNHTYKARVQTDVGEFVIDLDAKHAPETTNNFVFLSRYHFYDNVPFNRVKPGFVVQGGNPPGEGVTGPGYTFADENVPRTPDKYQIGQILMARERPNSNGSQFIIIMGAEGETLPLVFPLFGTVFDGMPVLRQIETDGSPDFTPKVLHTIQKITIIES
jgi:cyclophilin family peptidyl-prolyl cis-trans isomerase